MAMDKMNVLELAGNLIKELEGFRDKAYFDRVGVPTIGYGTTKVNGQPVNMGLTCTEEEALQWLKDYLVADYYRLVMWCHSQPLSIILTDNEAAAILSFSYNAGWKSFVNSSMAKQIINGDYGAAAKAFEKWNKIRINGKLTFSPGLFNRRMKEEACFVDEEKCGVG